MRVGKSPAGHGIMDVTIVLGEKEIQTEPRENEQEKERRCFLHAPAVKRTLSHGRRPASTSCETEGLPYFFAQEPSAFWTIQPGRAEPIHWSAKIFWMSPILLASMFMAFATSA